VFVGVGLLLTFFGLVSALFFATQGIAQGTDFNQTQNALRDLLHAASFKFYTSVAGLAASIALSLLVRSGIGVVEGGFDSLSQALEIQLVLKKDEVPGCELGSADAAPRLGWTSWAKTGSLLEDANDTILRG